MSDRDQAHPHDHGACCGGQGHAELPASPDSPVLVEVTRGGAVESRHRGHAAIVDADGRVVAHWGGLEEPVFPRSAIKPLQAIPLVETGALDALGLTEAELALACASHNGEARHTRLVGSWLAKIGLSVADLECGAHAPYDEETAAEMIRAGETPTALHNNCSGKHAGMLSTAKHRGEPVRGYVRFDHPVQQRILGTLEQMCGVDLSRAPRGVDGCSIPTIAVPLGSLALAMARIAEPKDLPDARARAVTRIRHAWGAHAPLIGGTTAFDTRVMQAASPGRILVKSGAEGVCCAVLPRLKLGIALKIEDGSARARAVAMAALLRYCKELAGESHETLDPFAVERLTNRAGVEVGQVRPAAGWPMARD
ncbi:MAG TPA: asparaginase [Azospirillaceae bacterium]|nr:asparaginase [Azospirillaceae bacterium]